MLEFLESEHARAFAEFNLLWHNEDFPSCASIMHATRSLDSHSACNLEHPREARLSRNTRANKMQSKQAPQRKRATVMQAHINKSARSHSARRCARRFGRLDGASDGLRTFRSTAHKPATQMSKTEAVGGRTIEVGDSTTRVIGHIRVITCKSQVENLLRKIQFETTAGLPVTLKNVQVGLGPAEMSRLMQMLSNPNNSIVDK